MLAKRILIGILLGAVFTLFPLGTIVFLFALASAFYIRGGIKTESRKFLLILFIAGFLLRVPLAFANYYAGLYFNVGADTQPDARVYNNNAFNIARLITGSDVSKYVRRDPILREGIETTLDAWGGKLAPIDSYQHGIYVYAIGLLYALLGYAPIAAKLINGLFGCISAILVYFIARSLTRSEVVSKLSAALAMFFPSIVYWSVTLLRDPLANLLFLIYVLSVINYMERNKGRYLAITAISMLFLGLLKKHIAILLIGGFMLIILVQIVKNMIFKARAGGRLIALMIMTIALMIFLPPSIPKISNFAVCNMAKIVKSNRSFSSNTDAANYILYENSFSGENKTHMNLKLPFYLLKALAYYLYSPFPWMVPYSHLLLLMFYPQNIFMIISIPFLFLGIISLLRRNFTITASILAITAMVMLPQAMAEGVIGNVVRHRDMFTPLMLIFQAYGFFLMVFNKKMDVIK